LEDKEKKSETTESDIKPKSLNTFDPIFKEKEKPSKKQDEETSSHDSQRLVSNVKSKTSKVIENKNKEQKEAKQSSSKSKSKSSTSKQDVHQETMLTQSDDMAERSENIIPVTSEIQPPSKVYFIINNFENFQNYKLFY
jgi:hypothetical protein